MKIDLCEVFANYFDKQVKPIAYAVYQKLEEGSICLDILQYNKLLSDGSYKNPFIEDDNKLTLPDDNNPFVSYNEKDYKPFIIQDNRVYLHRYYFYETIIINKIKSLIENEKENISSIINLILDNKNLINNLFNDNGNDINWQKIAALNILLNNFSIITGGPGTGKTTTIAKIIYIILCLFPDKKITLAAPTGKAAMRLNESLQKAINNIHDISEDIKEKMQALKASTIHRLLKSKRNSPYFHHNTENPLIEDVIIIDESSMIDGALMAKLFMAINDKSKLVLLGDKDQLASVEAGSIFGDFCANRNRINVFNKEQLSFIKNWYPGLSDNYLNKNDSILSGHITELTVSYRFNITNGIGKFSSDLINDKIILSDLLHKYQDNTLKIDENYDNNLFCSFCDYYEDYIKEKDILKAIEKLNKLKILCALRDGKTGVYEYNTKIEQYLSTKGLLKPDKLFYENQPIIITSNDYNLELFNGDTGIVRKDKDNKLMAWFIDQDGKLKPVPVEFLQNYETVFAMTVHKSQGSEFENVVVILPKNPDISILTKELLYTAITRAKKQVLIQGNVKTIEKISKRTVNRASGINERL